MPVLQLPRTDAPPWRARALVFEDPLSHELLRSLEQVAPTEATVLITGETGTGKEIVARHVHARSARVDAPFVAVNCGALSPTLIESELFGHEKAAFTGAISAKPGWFEAANGGTLFLDEIADLPLPAQVKLLRVLQEREVVRIGARRPIAIDVRLIAATNANLGQAVSERRFREDLFYRLHVAHLTIAPLRDRPGDILPLARHFLTRYTPLGSVEPAELTPDAEEKILAHRWPGNIRELENTMHHAGVTAREGRITAADLRLIADGPMRIAPSSPPPMVASVAEPTATLDAALLALFESGQADLLEHVQEALFRAGYRYSQGNQVRTARLLGTSRNVVRARLMQYGLLAPAARASSPASEHRAAASLPAARSDPAAVRVRIGQQPFGMLPLLKATRALEESFAAHGAKIEWTACNAGMQVMDAIAAGALDLGVVGEAPPVFAQAARVPLVYLAAEPPAPEGEAIVVRGDSSVLSVGDLRGKTIAVTRGANVVYFVVRALEEAGLTLDDVDLRSLQPLEARVEFLRGGIDAWATWNPILASVRQTTAARVLRDARGLASNRAFYVARRAFADAHPEVVDAFLGQVGAVGRWANESRDAAVKALAPHVDIPAEALEATLARTVFDLRPLDAEAMASQQRIADTFHRVNLITRSVQVGDAVWTPPWTERRSA
jgi:aliphatic sulfonates family ABC transporter substrate-binding protein